MLKVFLSVEFFQLKGNRIKRNLIWFTQPHISDMRFTMKGYKMTSYSPFREMDLLWFWVCTIWGSVFVISTRIFHLFPTCLFSSEFWVALNQNSSADVRIWTEIKYTIQWCLMFSFCFQSHVNEILHSYSIATLPLLEEFIVYSNVQRNSEKKLIFMLQTSTIYPFVLMHFLAN